MTDVQVVTIREAGEVVVLARGHVMHHIGNEGRSRRLTVHPVHRIGVGAMRDARYGHVVHTTGRGHAR